LSGKEKTANFFHNLALGIVDFVLNFFPWMMVHGFDMIWVVIQTD
jgi:hypothetical protein